MENLEHFSKHQLAIQSKQNLFPALQVCAKENLAGIRQKVKAR